MFVFPEVFPHNALLSTTSFVLSLFQNLPQQQRKRKRKRKRGAETGGGKPRKKCDETLMKTNKLHRHVQEKEQCVPFLIKYALRCIGGPYKTSSIFNVRTPPRRPLFANTGCFHDQRGKEQRDYFHRLSRLFFHACPILVITQIKTPC